MFEINDDIARDKIKNNLDTNFIVDAGAGSGKTTALVERIFSLIINKKVELSQIVVITFTIKAAEELKERIQEKFLSLINSNNSDNIKELLKMKFKDFSLMYIGTIHSFCIEILKEFPVESGIDIAFETLDSDDSNLITKQVWKNFLADHLSENKDCSELFDKYNIVEDVLFDYYKLRCSYPDIQFPYENIKEPEIEEIFKKLETLLEEIKPFVPIDIVDDFCEYFYSFNENKNYNKLDLILSLKRAKIKVKSWDDLSVAKKVKNQILESFILEELEPFFKKIKIYLYEKIIKLFNNAFNQYDLYKKEKNYLDFSDILLKTAEVLKTKIFIRKYLHEKYKYIFVDEFQDTDPLQSQIVLYLTDSRHVNCDWKDCIPESGSLFIVGDPKQSIYRFRRADINMYIVVKSIIKKSNGEELILSKNFRSAPEIINWVNNTFSENIFFPSKKDIYQTDFVAMSSNSKDKGFLKKISISGKMKAEDAVLENARIISNYIKSEVVSGRKKNSDFLVILFTKNRFNIYIKEFERNNISYSATGDSNVSSSLVMNDIRRLFKLLLEPYNEMLCYSVLKSSLFGFAEEMLFSYRLKEKGVFNIIDFDKQEYSSEFFKIIKSLEKLREYKKLFLSMSPSQAFKQILYDMDGFVEISLVSSLIEQVCANEIIKFYDLLGLVNFIEELISNNKLDRVDIDFNKKDEVRIMNLHQAKGLEAPVVILANPRGKPNKSPDLHIKHDTDNGFLSLVSVGILAESLYWEEYCIEEKRFLEAERMRLLYVAATRAKQELVVTYDSYEKYRNPWAILNEFISGFDEVVINENYEEKNEIKDSNEILRISNKKDVLAKLKIPTYKIDTITKLYHRDIVIQNKEKGYGPVFGTIVHKILDYSLTVLFVDKDSIFVDNLKTYVLLLYNSIEGEVAFSFDFLFNHIKEVLNSEFIKRIKNADEFHTEFPFMVNSKDGYLKGIIDVVFRENDKWFLVDYKTDFFSRQMLPLYVEKYRSQIEAYQRCWEDLSDKKIECGYLYFTFLDECCDF